MKIKTLNLSKMKTKKLQFVTSFLLFLCSASSVLAQETNIITKMNSWKSTLKTVLNVGVAVFALVGGFLIFIQYMQGNESAQKNFIRFVIGLAIFGLVDLVAQVFIGTATTP